MAQLQCCIVQYVVFYSAAAIVWVRKSFVDTHTAWCSYVGRILCFWHSRNKHLLKCTVTSKVWPQQKDKGETKFYENGASIYNKITRFLKSGNNKKHSAWRFLEGPCFEGRRGRDFPHESKRSPKPNLPPAQWALGHFPGGNAAGPWRREPTPSSARFLHG